LLATKTILVRVIKLWDDAVSSFLNKGMGESRGGKPQTMYFSDW